MDLVVHGGAVPTFLLERLLAATGARAAIRASADVAIKFGGLDALLNLLATDRRKEAGAGGAARTAGSGTRLRGLTSAREKSSARR